MGYPPKSALAAGPIHFSCFGTIEKDIASVHILSSQEHQGQEVSCL